MAAHRTQVGVGFACVLLALSALAWSGRGPQPLLLLSENLLNSEQELQGYSFFDSSLDDYSKTSAAIDAQVYAPAFSSPHQPLGGRL